MLYRRLDENHDPMFGAGKYNYLKDIEAVSQAIDTKIKLLKSEWWEDVEDGTPLFEKILSQRITKENLNAIDIVIKDRILKVPNVNAITKYVSEVDRINRSYTAVLNINTMFGDLEEYQINL